MCGIAAMWTRRGRIREAAVHRATQALVHRGPDAQRTWMSSDGTVALGHTRLSIIDLEGGAQPIANESGDIHIAVNGEFYGFEGVRRNLESQGHRFRTGSDSEIALHAYEQYGLECLHHLRGEFAFIIWDGRRRELLACRDRFGIKPLYYAWTGDQLYLASEVKALIAAGVPAEWDDESFYRQIFCFTAPDRTLYRGVRQLPPAHHLTVSETGIRVSRYWDLDYKEPQDESGDDSERVAQFRAEFEEAVHIRLRADVPVGCFLSGGIDSSAVLSLASRTAEPVRAFTVAFEGTDFDESPEARRTARFSNAEFQVVAATPGRLAASFADAVWHAETLGMNLHGVARYLLCAAVRKAGYKTCLTGEGADEILAGYAPFRQDLTGSRMRMPRTLEGVEARLGFVPAWIEKLARERAIYNLFFRREYIEAHSEHNVYRAFVDSFDVPSQLQGRSRLRQSMYLWTRSVLPNYILFAERLEMAHGIETRLPYLDHKLFEFTRTLPDRMLIGATEKFVLREAVRGLLPDDVYRRGKQPFLAPSSWLTPGGAMRELACDLFSGECLRHHPFFDPDPVVEALDSLIGLPPSQRQTVESALLVVLCSCVLQEKLRTARHSAVACMVN